MREMRNSNILCICSQCECEMKTPEKTKPLAIKFVLEKRPDNWDYIGEDILLCSICNRPEMRDKWAELMERHREIPPLALGDDISVTPAKPGKRSAPRPQFRSVKKR